MIDRLLSAIAPHLCCSCGEIGTLFCENCKYDIITEASANCISCGNACDSTKVCTECKVHSPYSRAWCVGERSGALQRLIGDFKFQNMYAAYEPLGELLLQTIDQLPSDTIVVPIPTVASHMRERGYDHTVLLAKYIAKHRNIRMRRLVVRATCTKQRDANRSQRIAQAKVAFRISGKIDTTAPYLLIDDVVTTGATIRYAAQTLRDAGAQEVWVAVIARQPLD
jgi:ComF family protein